MKTGKDREGGRRRWGWGWARLCALGLLLLVACVGANVKLDAVEDHPGEIVIPVTLHVATKRGQAVVTDAQIVASIRRANHSR